MSYFFNKIIIVFYHDLNQQEVFHKVFPNFTIIPPICMIIQTSAFHFLRFVSIRFICMIILHDSSDAFA